MYNIVFLHYKIDARLGRHIRGLICRGNRFYRIWGKVGCRLYFRPCGSHTSVHLLTSCEKNLSKNKGYKEIGTGSVEKNWPEFRFEIESYFMLKELTNA